MKVGDKLSGIDNFRKRMSLTGNSIREEAIHNSKAFLYSVFKDDISYQEQGIDIYNTDTTIYPRLFNFKTVSNIPQMNISSLLEDNFEKGDILVVKNTYWLCVTKDFFNEISNSGTIQQCNYILEWQNSDGDIKSCPCIVSSSLSDGVDEDDVLTVGNNQRIVLLPLNDETNQLSINKRLFIDNSYQTPYKITNPDNVSRSIMGEGLLVLVLTQEQLSDKDRPDLHICDYFEPMVQPSTTCEINYSYSPIIYVGGGAKTFTAIFKDDKGNILTEITPVWTTDILDDDKTKILFKDNKDGTCSLQAVNDLDLIGKTVRLTLTDDSNVYSTYLDVEIKGLI